MCGIYARIETRTDDDWHRANGQELTPILGWLEHRGPDAKGWEFADIEWAFVELAMTRLKIVDQSNLTVPYHFERLGVTLAFNGEIYNWRELRAELSGPWETECDAEVVASAWRKWGVGCLEHFNGMWGLVLVDTRSDVIFIARDRAGEKPLYYANRNGVVHVSSEIKAFPFELEPEPCADADTLEFDFGASTPFKGIKSLEPGTYIELTKPDDVTSCGVQTWWALPHPPSTHDLRRTIASYTDELEALIVDAVRLRRVSQRPIALQLSGGLDSAIIQTIAGCEALYCVTFPDIDSLSMARLAAPNDSVKPIEFTRKEMIDALPEIAYYLDTPATWTACCQWFMNKQAADDGNVVILSGEGADELFGGYSRYRVLFWLGEMMHDAQLTNYGPLMTRSLGGALNKVAIRMLDRSHGQQAGHAARLMRRYSCENWSLIDQMCHVDFYTTMQVLLRMADRMAMAFSIENRSPFFDYRVMEFASALPVHLKVDRYGSKLLLRRVAERLGVNSLIINESSKKGLAIPQSWGPDESRDRKWFVKLMDDAWQQATKRMDYGLQHITQDRTKRFFDTVIKGTPTVAVIGGGYVGLPLAVTMASKGFDVVIYDIDESKVQMINDGVSYIGDVSNEELGPLVRQELIHATDNPDRALATADVIMICVPTPLQHTREPDTSFVMSALEDIDGHAAAPYLVALESTVAPGFTREVVETFLEDRGVYVSFSPERVDPGHHEHTITKTPKVVGATSKRALGLAQRFYSRFIDNVHTVGSTDAAEMVKLLENIYRSVNIALVNEIVQACHVLSIDAREVIDAAATKPYGFQRFDPGPGVGGHCINLDPHYFTSKLRTLKQHARLTELASEINEAMPRYVVDRLAEELNKQGRALRGAMVLMVGVAYKPDVTDVRESPALEIIQELSHRGVQVDYIDSLVPQLEIDYGTGDVEHRASITPETWNDTPTLYYTAAIVVTDHTFFDYPALVNRAGLVLDTRGVMRQFELPNNAPGKVVQL